MMPKSSGARTRPKPKFTKEAICMLLPHIPYKKNKQRHYNIKHIDLNTAFLQESPSVKKAVSIPVKIGL